jgi:fatty acid desaturase
MSTSASPRLGGMVPGASALTAVLPTARITPNGHPKPDLRAELRRIPNVRNAISIVSIYAQNIGIVWIALQIHHPALYIATFVLMGRAHAQILAMMHESVHRLLFTHRKFNDFAGRWLLGYFSFVNSDAYRYVHMAHHREEFGPNEPDIPLYANYPIMRDSFWRKMRRDALGITGFKMLRDQFRHPLRKDGFGKRTQLKILTVHALLFIAISAVSHPAVYIVFWLIPQLTVWRVMNRLRSIAEHGGLRADDDRRVTTHSVRQHPIASFLFVPFNLGWHIAHHTDAGIPFRSLPKYHAELRKSGYVNDDYEYPNYRTLWRALRSAT